MGTHVKPSIFRGYVIFPIFLMAYNLHGFHGYLGSKGPYYWVDEWVYPLLLIWIFHGSFRSPPQMFAKEMKAGILLKKRPVGISCFFFGVCSSSVCCFTTSEDSKTWRTHRSFWVGHFWSHWVFVGIGIWRPPWGLQNHFSGLKKGKNTPIWLSRAAMSPRVISHKKGDLECEPPQLGDEN